MICSARCFGLLVFLPAVVLLSACAGGASTNTRDLSVRGTRAEICKAGDTIVRSAAQCLQDDAACYQIANGDWCTGSRAATCPAGSSPIAAGNACPSGVRCITISESLTCGISYR